MMWIQQLYTGCVSEAAYYVESNGECAIIDPLRDVDVYINLAKERNATIQYILETHVHSDFVSGHFDLAKQTGATIVYGPQMITSYPVHIAKDGEEFKVGSITIQALHTPGHTLESTCYLLKDEKNYAHCIFSGDTLLAGDVGRPDAAQAGLLTTEDMAGMLYHSLQIKILPLADEVIVYPAHRAGSPVSVNQVAEINSTIGEQKATNPALQQASKEDFIKYITKGLITPPRYFSMNAKMNKEGYEALETLVKRGMQPLSVVDFKSLSKKEKTCVLDTRTVSVFTDGFIPGSISIGLEGRFEEWAGALLPFDESVLLVSEEGKEEESIIRLARVGINNVIGYLKDGFDAWRQSGEAVDMIINVEADELAMDLPHDDNLIVVDVRKETEYASGHVKDAVNFPLGEITDPALMANIDDRDNLYVHCSNGYRSVIAASFMKRQGFHNLRNVTEGWEKMKEQKMEIVKESSALN